MAPLGPSVDLFGDGSLWAISVPGHTDDDVAYLINGPEPVLLTGDASHFAWAFNTGVARVAGIRREPPAATKACNNCVPSLELFQP